MTGRVKIKSVKVGDIDGTKPESPIAGFNIYEDILNPYGPLAEIRFVDPTDALGQNRLNGSYDKDVEIKFGLDDSMGGGGSAGGETTLKLKMYQNRNLNDQSVNNTGSGHHKQYDIRAVSPEFLNAQGNFVEKSFNDKTSKVVEHILKKGFKTKRQIELGETKGKRRIVISRKHPMDALKQLQSEHVSEKYKSSTFALFQKADKGGEHKYVFKTFEELFEQEPKVKLKQTTNLNFGSSAKEKQNSIMWFKPSKNFDSGPRALNKPAEYAFDYTTHKVIATKGNDSEKFKFADKQGVYEKTPSYVEDHPSVLRYAHDKANNKEKHETSKAVTDRAAFLSHLAQNSAELEVYYNPEITLGSMIEIEIPKKVTKTQGETETQFNGKCLVVAIRTKYRVANEPPNCTMILRVVKASYKQGGDSSG